MISLPFVGSERRIELNPSKIVALGLNYRDHVAEVGHVLPGHDGTVAKREVPSEPLLFAKGPNVLVGPGEPIVIPRSFLARSKIAEPRTDYEAELAIIVGRRMRRVSPDEALSHVLGYTCFNDVSQRNIQNGDRSGWFRGKSFDSFGPIGPAVAPGESLGDPQNLAIECRLNGRTVQHSRTSAMIFPIADLLSYISWNMTLEPGDIVATGTPSGVGALAPGDVVEIEIEGIGVLSNPVTTD